jgi:hypothetical protein
MDDVFYRHQDLEAFRPAFMPPESNIRAVTVIAEARGPADYVHTSRLGSVNRVEGQITEVLGVGVDFPDTSHQACALQTGPNVSFGDSRQEHSISTKACLNCTVNGKRTRVDRWYLAGEVFEASGQDVPLEQGDPNMMQISAAVRRGPFPATSIADM